MKHKDELRWFTTLFNQLGTLKDGLRWFKTVLYHLNTSLYFAGSYTGGNLCIGPILLCSCMDDNAQISLYQPYVCWSTFSQFPSVVNKFCNYSKKQHDCDQKSQNQDNVIDKNCPQASTDLPNKAFCYHNSCR